MISNSIDPLRLISVGSIGILVLVGCLLAVDYLPSGANESPELTRELKDDDDFSPRKGRFPTPRQAWSVKKRDDYEDAYGQVRLIPPKEIKLFKARGEIETWELSDLSKRDQEYLEWHQSGILIGKPVYIIDGDTFELRTEEGRVERIRLHGIDAPEVSQKPEGLPARDALDGLLVKNQWLKVHLHKKDRNRWVGTVFRRHDGANINAEMIRNGHAWHATKFSNSQLFADAQKEAKAKSKGIWASESQPIPPWQARNGRKKSVAKPKYPTVPRQMLVRAAAANFSRPKPLARPFWEYNPQLFVVHKRTKTTHFTDGCHHVVDKKPGDEKSPYRYSLEAKEAICSHCLKKREQLRKQ